MRIAVLLVAALVLPPQAGAQGRHQVDVHVLRIDEKGARVSVGAGVPVEFEIAAQESEARVFKQETDKEGIAHFPSLPSTPRGRSVTGHTIRAVYQGVSYPFDLNTTGLKLAIEVADVTDDITQLSLAYSFVEMIPDEDSLFVRQRIVLNNGGHKTINLKALVDGGLRIPTPEGAKHPELHGDGIEEIAEVRGKDVYYKGAVLPLGNDSAEFTVVYSIPYDAEVFEWSQTVGIPTTGALVVAPQGRQDHQRIALELGLKTRDGIGRTHPSNMTGDRYEILRADGLDLPAGRPFRFAVTGLPAVDRMPRRLLFAALIVVVIGVFAYRRSGKDAEDTSRQTRTHLEIERDRLLVALKRMRKARDKGRMTESRFEREREVITARMVSVYRALDRLDA